MTFLERVAEWTIGAVSAVSEGESSAVNIHLPDLDQSLADAAQWPTAIRECLGCVEALRQTRGFREGVAVGVMVKRPLDPRELAEPPVTFIVKMRTYVPPVLCVFRLGCEPWKVTEVEYDGRCMQHDVAELELHLCEWWDPDDQRIAAAVWLRTAPSDV